MPFKDKKSADVVRKQLGDLSTKIGQQLRPVYINGRIRDELGKSEIKPPLLFQQRVVYHFQCDRCEANYVGYTSRHLYQRVEEHQVSGIGKHIKSVHKGSPNDLNNMFSILRRLGINLIV